MKEDGLNDTGIPSMIQSIFLKQASTSVSISILISGNSSVKGYGALWVLPDRPLNLLGSPLRLKTS